MITFQPLRFLAGPGEKWCDIKTAQHGERLIKCLTINANIILGTQVKSLSILTLKNCIITIEVNVDFQLFHKNVPKMVRFLK